MLNIKRPSKDKEAQSLDAIKAEVTGKTEKTKRLNAEIPESFHTEVFIFAKKHKMSVTALLTTALQDYMSKYSNE